MTKSSRILITGAHGFIGSHLVGKLCALGHNVYTFGRSATAPPALSELPLQHIRGDLNDFKAVRDAVKGCDVVFHLAGMVSYRLCDLQKQIDINVGGTRHVMTACYEQNVGRVIHTSSIAAIGIPAAGTIGTEEMEYNLKGKGLTYCDTKYDAELVVHDFFLKGLPAVILNPGIVFGEGDTHPHHHAIFAAMSKGSMIGVPPGGVGFADINDVVDAHINALKMGRAGQRYALVSANLSYWEAALLFAAIHQTRGPVFTIPGGLLVAAGAFCEIMGSTFGFAPPLTRQAAWLSQHKIFFSAKKAMSELAFKQTDFTETIKRTSRYYLSLNHNSRYRSK